MRTPRPLVWAAPLVLTCAALAGCLSHARLSEPDVRLPAAYETPAGSTDASLPVETLDHWWTLFNDSQLTELIGEALTASPDAKSAFAVLQEARANREQALYPFQPQGDPQFLASNQFSQSSFAFYPPGSVQTYTGQWNVTWEADLFGDIRTAARAANETLASARFDYEATRISLAASMATALFQARGDAVLLEEAIQDARIAHDLARTGKLKADVGLATDADTARLDSDAETADAAVAQLRAANEADRRTILVLAGRGAAPLESLPIEARLIAPPKVPASTPGELLTRRPDVRQAEFTLASAADTLQLEKLQLFPNLIIEPGGEISQTEGAYASLTKLWSIAGNLSVPILDRPKFLSEVRVQRAVGQQAVAAYEKAVQSAYSDTEKALTLLSNDEDRLQDLTKAEARSRYAFDAATRGYKAGLTDITTLLQAEQTWRSVRTSLTSVNTAVLQDVVTAFKALGGGWTPLTERESLKKPPPAAS